MHPRRVSRPPACDPPRPTNAIRKTISVAIGASCVENAVSHELGSLLAGQLARAAAIFNVDEVVVLDDGPKHAGSDVNRAAALLAKILQYQETPQYLRKALIPMHELYRYCGMLAPLDAPHHLRATEWFEYREGVVTNQESGQSVCDIGLDVPALVGTIVPHNTRVTLFVGKTRHTVVEGGREYIKASVVNPLDVKRTTGRYWGYNVRVARSIEELFNKGPFGGYDLTIGTSERGEVTECCSLTLTDYQHALIVIGGPSGLEYLLQNDPCREQHASPATLFDRYLNVCPNQGSRTIRTEEAVLLCLMYLKPALAM
jgi:predicted SPOUT superfamily RNA methylase MTH1